jgi:hypothetical protein
MKKFMFLVVVFGLLFTFTADLFAEREVIVTKCRLCGNQGSGALWDYVYEKHEKTGLFGWGSGRSILKCKGRGDQPCEFQNMPEDLVVSDEELGVDELLNYAENEIINGNLNGTYTDIKNTSHGQFSRTVTWSATAVDESEINITIVPVE